MSTLLTPIITQLELDRDRFKELINGDETVIVALESRSEKSIKGQVIDRIDEVAGDFISARDAVVAIESNVIAIETNVTDLRDETQDLRDDVASFSTTTEGARDQTLSYFQDISDWRDTIEDQYNQVNTWQSAVQANTTTTQNNADQVELWKNQVEGWRNETQTFRNDTAASVIENADLLNDIQNAASGFTSLSLEPLGASPSMLYPTATTYIDVTTDVTLVGSSSRPIGFAGSFSGRIFTVQRFDSGLGGWQDVINETVDAFHYTIPADTLDASDQLRWKIEDLFEANDRNNAYTYETRNNEWVDINTAADTGLSLYESIDAPVIVATPNNDLSISVTLSGYNAPVSGHQVSSVSLVDKRNNLTIFSTRKTQNFDGDENLEDFVIPSDIITPNKEYTVRAVFGGTDNNVFSEWTSEDVVSFSSYYDDSDVRKLDNIKAGIITSDDIVSDTSTVLFRSDRTTSPSITLDTPQSDEFVNVKLYLFGGTGTPTFAGTLAWDVSINDVNIEADLGTTFTLFNFTWVGDTWVGKIEAKD